MHAAVILQTTMQALLPKECADTQLTFSDTFSPLEIETKTGFSRRFCMILPSS